MPAAEVLQPTTRTGPCREHQGGLGCLVCVSWSPQTYQYVSYSRSLQMPRLAVGNRSMSNTRRGKAPFFLSPCSTSLELDIGSVDKATPTRIAAKHTCKCLNVDRKHQADHTCAPQPVSPSVHCPLTSSPAGRRPHTLEPLAPDAAIRRPLSHEPCMSHKMGRQLLGPWQPKCW